MNFNTYFSLFILIILVSFPQYSSSKCAFKINDEGKPVKVDDEPHIVEGLTQCLQYNGQLGCCDMNNDIQQSVSYTQIDGVFGSQGDGCDVCAINLKRVWCEYACSPRQAQFTEASEDYYPVPNPNRPDQTVMVQKVKLRMHPDTACDLFSSCKRIGFVTSVSALNSPAGFMNFQGHNAINQAFQDIEVQFTHNKSISMHFDGKGEQEKRSQPLYICNYTTSQQTVHGFPFIKNCTCNNCGDSCDENSGFIYAQSKVLQGFDYVLVGGTWGVSIIIAVAITYSRRYKSRNNKEQ